MSMVAPCKDCTDRHTACHGSCEKYKEWRDSFRDAKRRSEKERYGLWVPSSYAREKANALNCKKPQRWR